MKKHNYYIYGIATCLSAGLLGTAACTDGNDWVQDAAYDRLFSPDHSSFAASVRGATAIIRWESTPSTEYYVIEASTDSLYDDIAAGGEHSILFGEDGSIKQSPDTLFDLLSETTYYLRIKSVGNGKESKWTYLNNPAYKLTTQTEQILNDVPSTDITAESVVLTWRAGMEVTHIDCLLEGAATTRTLTDEEKAAGRATLTDLKANAQYTFNIYNGETLRGTMEVTTLQVVLVDSEVAVTQTSATFTWDEAAGEVTGYFFTEGTVSQNPEEANGELTEEQIANRSITISGLEANTTYTIAVMRNRQPRAMQTFKTAMGAPSDYTAVTVGTADEWANALSNNNGKLAITLTADIDLMTGGGRGSIPANITALLVMGRGGNVTTNKPTISLNSISLGAAEMESVEFFNVNLQGRDAANGYVLNSSNEADAHLAKLAFTSCNLSQMRGIVRTQSTGRTIDAISFDDCFMSVIGNYRMCCIENSITTDIEMKNSTYVPDSESERKGDDKGIISSKGTTTTISFDQCTLYGFTNSIIEDESGITVNSIRNTIISGPVNKSFFSKSNAASKITSVEGLYVTQETSFRTSIGEITMEYAATEFFSNPGQNDFTVNIESYKAYGDQRWNQ